jgi:hypothetical protein
VVGFKQVEDLAQPWRFVNSRAAQEEGDEVDSVTHGSDRLTGTHDPCLAELHGLGLPRELTNLLLVVMQAPLKIAAGVRWADW